MNYTSLGQRLKRVCVVANYQSEMICHRCVDVSWTSFVYALLGVDEGVPLSRDIMENRPCFEKRITNSNDYVAFLNI